MSRTPEDTAAAEVIRATPALLSEARGWIQDTFSPHDTLTAPSPGEIVACLRRHYAGGCAEFVRNSAPLIPAPHNHIYPDRTLEDTALQFTCSGCNDVVLYW